MPVISIHALRVEGDGLHISSNEKPFGFLSTPSGWRATELSVVPDLPDFISIHALRVEGDFRDPREWLFQALISIHALRVEGDAIVRSPIPDFPISIHALRVEGDDIIMDEMQNATENFYPRPPGGGRPVGVETLPPDKLISIHALRVEGDAVDMPEMIPAIGISIHALRVEGDRRRCLSPQTVSQFLSTPSGWRATGRHIDLRKPCIAFLSTPSGWRATVTLSPDCLTTPISIHALRVEGDYRAAIVPPMFRISIHALRVEGDNTYLTLSFLSSIFLSTPSGWRATAD